MASTELSARVHGEGGLRTPAHSEHLLALESTGERWVSCLCPAETLTVPARPETNMSVVVGEERPLEARFRRKLTSALALTDG